MGPLVEKAHIPKLTVAEPGRLNSRGTCYKKTEHTCSKCINLQVLGGQTFVIRTLELNMSMNSSPAQYKRVG